MEKATKPALAGEGNEEAERLAKLAEIPAPGSEEWEGWLEAAKRCVLAIHRGLLCTTSNELLALMSEARKQGQRDVLATRGNAEQGAPVQWGDPKTVAGLIAQLRTLPPDAPIYGTFHGPDFPEDGRRRTGVRGVTLSREYVKGRWLSRDPDAELQHVIWTKPAAPEEPVAAFAQSEASHV